MLGLAKFANDVEREFWRECVLAVLQKVGHAEDATMQADRCLRRYRVHNRVSDDEVLVQVVQGAASKIYAIKGYREVTGLPLKEAKDAVDPVWAKLRPENPQVAANNERLQAAAVDVAGAVSLYFPTSVWDAWRVEVLREDGTRGQVPVQTLKEGDIFSVFKPDGSQVTDPDTGIGTWRVVGKPYREDGIDAVDAVPED